MQVEVQEDKETNAEQIKRPLNSIRSGLNVIMSKGNVPEAKGRHTCRFKWAEVASVVSNLTPVYILISRS